MTSRPCIRPCMACGGTGMVDAINRPTDFRRQAIIAYRDYSEGGNRPIQAIKALRTTSGCGLKESKDEIDIIRDLHRNNRAAYLALIADIDTYMIGEEP